MSPEVRAARVTALIVFVVSGIVLGAFKAPYVVGALAVIVMLSKLVYCVYLLALDDILEREYDAKH